MFKLIKNLWNKVKDSHKRHKAEYELYMSDFYFYREEQNLELYDLRPVTIFLNGHRIYADNPCRILTDGSSYFAEYEYLQVLLSSKIGPVLANNFPPLFR